jgi:hypothetical protein
MQALKLIRACAEVSPTTISASFVRSLVAVSAERDDKFRRLAIQTLLDLSLKNPEIVAVANGFRTLFDAILQPDCVELVEPIITCMIHLHDSPETR